MARQRTPQTRRRPALEARPGAAQPLSTNHLSTAALAWPSLPAAAVVVSALVAAGVGIGLLLSFWPFTVDDAFITFRYAQNLAAGSGATFNPGWAPVEGYTSFSWMLLLAVPHLLHLDPVVFAKVAGILSTLGHFVPTLLLGARTLGRDRRGVRSAAIVGSTQLLGLLPATWIHAISGMETALFACLLAFFLLAAADLGSRADRRAAWRAGVLGLLVGLTRPEGNLAVVAALAVALVLAPRDRRRTALGWIAFTYALPLAGYLGWRLAYFRMAFPLAFYVKVDGSTGLSGVGEVSHFGRHFLLWLSPLIGAGLPGLRRDLLPALAAATTLIAFFLVPSPIMAYDWRYLFPVVPLLVALATPGLEMLAGRPPRSAAALPRSASAPSRRRVAVVLAVQAVIVGGIGVAFLYDVNETIMAKRRYAQALEQGHVGLGRLLSEVAPGEQQPLLAVADAGAIPYYSRWRTIDTFGLNDAVIARSGRHDPDYVLSQRPDLVILNSKSGFEFRPRMPFLNDLYSRCLDQGLVQLEVWFARQDEYYLWLLGDPQNPVVQRMRERIVQQRRGQGVAILEVHCTSCNGNWRVQANTGSSKPLRPKMLPFPPDDALRCPKCGATLDLSAARRDIEQRYGAPIVAP
jgi:hypothetical protein